jgi:hypothetical protein
LLGLAGSRLHCLLAQELAERIVLRASDGNIYRVHLRSARGEILPLLTSADGAPRLAAAFGAPPQLAGLFAARHLGRDYLAGICTVAVFSGARVFQEIGH